MSSIMIETIADYAKKSRPQYLRLVEVIIFQEHSETDRLKAFRDKMSKYANVSKYNHFIQFMYIFKS